VGDRGVGGKEGQSRVLSALTKKQTEESRVWSPRGGDAWERQGGKKIWKRTKYFEGEIGLRKEDAGKAGRTIGETEPGWAG